VLDDFVAGEALVFGRVFLCAGKLHAVIVALKAPGNLLNPPVGVIGRHGDHRFQGQDIQDCRYDKYEQKVENTF
jgi:hypothetical protein